MWKKQIDANGWNTKRNEELEKILWAKIIVGGFGSNGPNCGPMLLGHKSEPDHLWLGHLSELSDVARPQTPDGHHWWSIPVHLWTYRCDNPSYCWYTSDIYHSCHCWHSPIDGLAVLYLSFSFILNITYQYLRNLNNCVRETVRLHFNT